MYPWYVPMNISRAKTEWTNLLSFYESSIFKPSRTLLYQLHTSPFPYLPRPVISRHRPFRSWILGNFTFNWIWSRFKIRPDIVWETSSFASASFLEISSFSPLFCHSNFAKLFNELFSVFHRRCSFFQAELFGKAGKRIKTNHISDFGNAHMTFA